MTNKKPKDFTIFRYSTMLALTRAGITTFEELEKMIMYLNNEENRVLAEFRDALLHDLMSGKIDISGEPRNPYQD